MDMLNVVMLFDSQVFFLGGEAAEAVGEDHILPGLALYGGVILLHAE